MLGIKLSGLEGGLGELVRHKSKGALDRRFCCVFAGRKGGGPRGFEENSLPFRGSSSLYHSGAFFTKAMEQ
jgi:hypothetical protein